MLRKYGKKTVDMLIICMLAQNYYLAGVVFRSAPMKGMGLGIWKVNKIKLHSNFKLCSADNNWKNKHIY